jgi:hypothetical protein
MRDLASDGWLIAFPVFIVVTGTTVDPATSLKGFAGAMWFKMSNGSKSLGLFTEAEAARQFCHGNGITSSGIKVAGFREPQELIKYLRGVADELAAEHVEGFIAIDPAVADSTPKLMALPEAISAIQRLV